MRYEDFARYYDEIFPLGKAQTAFMTEYVNTASRVLELGCGTGQLAGYIASRCGELVAIDNDPQMIDIARANFPELEFRVMDILAIADLPGYFDLIYSTGNVLSYLDNAALEELTGRVVDKLAPNGLWLSQVVNWDYFAGKGSWQFPDKISNNMVFQRSYQFHSDQNAVDFDLELRLADGQCFRDRHRLYRRTSEQYCRVYGNAGLLARGCWLDWEKTPWRPDSTGGIIQLWEKPAR